MLFFTSFKVGRLIYELAIQEFFVVILAPSDLNSGRRISALIKSIGSGFFIIFVTAVLMKFFLIGSAYVNANMSGLTAAFCMIFMAWATVDGPNFIERIIGIDAGISSGFRLLMSAYHGSRMAIEGAKAAGSVVGAAGRGIAGLGGFAVGASGAGSSKNNSNSIYSSQNSGDQQEKNEQLGNSLYSDSQNSVNADESNTVQSQDSVNQGGDSIAGGDTGTGDSIYTDKDNGGIETGDTGDNGEGAPDVVGGAETGSPGIDDGLYNDIPAQDSPYVGGQDTDNLNVPGGVPGEELNSTSPSKTLLEDSIYKDTPTQKSTEASLKEKEPNPAPKAADQGRDQGRDQGNKKSIISSARRGYAAGKKFREGVLRATGGEDRKK